MRRSARSLLRNRDGAVAPTIALSLIGLIAVGGIAVDYSRLVSMDTELQGAADQAALAAAAQLDGGANACSRAANAARSMISNETRMANDGSANGRAVTIPLETSCDATGQVRFWQDQAKTVAATTDANAKFVEVTVDARTANYALTPIAAAFSSGSIAATAFAGLGSAICRVPPVMICNPQETAGSATFNIGNLIGKGLKLVSQGGGAGAWAPGNYGYLNIPGYDNGAPGVRDGLGWDNPPGDCTSATGVDTKPGVTTTVTDSLNTRFDIYDTTNSCPTGGTCAASIDSVKDVRRPADASGGNSCKIHNQGWQLDTSGVSYYGADYPRTNAALPTTITPSAMGHPRDICHSVDSAVSGACTGAIGDGAWDRDAYFRTNYGWTAAQWQANTGLSPTAAVTAANYASRYNVYSWEIAHKGQSIGGRIILDPNPAGATGSTLVSHGAPVCSPAQGYGNGATPGPNTPDRREITVAVVNCLQQGVNGSSTGVAVADWMDVFLVEPSLDRQRTNAGDIYVEVIRRSANAQNGAVQVIKKSVPYLIE